MFILNLGYKWGFMSLDGLKGAIILPSLNPAPRVIRDRGADVQTLLLDPQLYLASLKAERRTKVCARLAGYPWFSVPGVNEFNSDEQGRRQWENQIRQEIEKIWPGKPPEDIERSSYDAIVFQIERGCTDIILPSPLLDQREDEGATLGEWIDAGFNAAEELEIAQPLLATIAVNEATLNENAFKNGGFIESIVDQVTARKEINGVYIVIAQTGIPSHPFEISENVARAYLKFVYDFSKCGKTTIITNFADLIGLVAIGLGATTFASGQSVSLRSLYIDGFRDEGGGVALPHFYSHKVAAEYLTETDLDKICEKQLIRRIADETETSAILIDTLLRHQSASSLPNWAESQNNLQSAQQHFIERLVLEGNLLKSQKLSERINYVIDWLDSAEANALLIHKRLKVDKLGRRPCLDVWCSLIQEFIKSKQSN